jgi:hypothetical protein
MSRTRRAVVVLLLALAGLTGTATVAHAQDDVPWTVGTAAGEFGADRDNYAYTVDPGGRLDDGLVITNHGTTPLALAVYGADAFTTAGGELDLVTRDTTSTGVGAWLHPRRDAVTVQPGQSTGLPFTLTVPDDATPGDHMGGIVTSLRRDGVERRVGIRVRLRVGGRLEPRLSVEDLRVAYAGTPNPFGAGDATITYTIHNTGDAIVAARQTASLSGPFGTGETAAGTIADSPQLLPGQTWQVSVPVRDVAPALRLTASVTLVPLLTDAAGSTAPLAAVETTAHGWAVQWTLLLVVGCVLVVVVLAFRRRRPGPPSHDAIDDATDVAVDTPPAASSEGDSERRNDERGHHAAR